MKLFTKVTLVVSSIFLSLGIIVMVIASCCGGTVMGWWDKENVDFTADWTETYTNVSSLDFSFRAADVLIQTGPEFGIEAANTRSSFRSSVEDGVWTIRDSDSGSWFPFRYREERIVITLPEDFVAERIRLDIGAGQIKADFLQCGESSLQVGAGNLEIKKLITGSSKMECGLGNMDIKGTLNGSAHIHCGMGNVSLEWSGREKQFNYDISVGMGNAQIGGRQYAGIHDKNIENNASEEIRVECGMGNVSVAFSD